MQRRRKRKAITAAKHIQQKNKKSPRAFKTINFQKRFIKKAKFLKSSIEEQSGM